MVVGVLGTVFSKRCRPSDVLRSVSAEPGFRERGTLRGHIKGKASPVSNGLGPSLRMHTRVRTHTHAFCLHTPEVIMIYDVGGNAAIPRDSRD